jgi:hypothetical protein
MGENVSGRVALVLAEESSNIFRTAFLLFASYVDGATSFAQNCGGGGSAPDLGRELEDLWLLCILGGY